MKKVLLAAIAAAYLASAGSAGAAPKCNDSYPLHGAAPHVAASCGVHVKGVQWMLGGHRPSVYTKVKPTFKAAPNGAYGARTKAAVKAMKFRIGYPQKGQCGARSNEVNEVAGRLFVATLRGKPRPVCWVGLASKRVKGAVVPGASTSALRIKDLMLSQLGTHEVPFGSNRGPRISYASGGYGPYQGSTGAFGLAWCASFDTWALKLIIGHGFGSANDAYVPAILAHAQAMGWLQAKPRVGAFVAFLTQAGNLGSAYHIGYVIKLVGGTAIQTIEGNASVGWGGMVAEVYRPYARYSMVYVYVPGVA